MKTFPVLLLLLLFSACATNKNTRSPVFITNTASFALLPPDCIQKNLDMIQRISGTYGKNQFDVNAWVKADKTEIVMELLNDMGNSLGTLNYSGGGVRFTSSFFPKNLKAEYIVADFQLCFYKVEALRSALGKLILKTEKDFSETEKRFVYDNNNCIIEIEKNPDFIKYINHLRGYSYTIHGDFL